MNYRTFCALACHRSTEEPTAFCVIRPMPRAPFKDALLSAYMHLEPSADIDLVNAIVNKFCPHAPANAPALRPCVFNGINVPGGQPEIPKTDLPLRAE